MTSQQATRLALLAKLRDLRRQEDRILADLETIDRPLTSCAGDVRPLVKPEVFRRGVR